MNRVERRRQAKADEKKVLQGIDPDVNDIAPIAAMSRQMHSLFEKAKRTGRVDAPVELLYEKVTATLAAKPMLVACARGCSHCCNGWVSTSAPEILYMASRVRERGEAWIRRVMDANAITHSYSKGERPNHPNPCAMLENDACGLYEARPFACRLAVSMDAEACRRLFRLLEKDGTIPTPTRFMRAREFYQIALTAALIRAGLPYRYYDLTGGLARVLAHEDAEEAWLGGEDVFKGVQMDEVDLLTTGNGPLIYRLAHA